MKYLTIVEKDDVVVMTLKGDIDLSRHSVLVRKDVNGYLTKDEPVYDVEDGVTKFYPHKQNLLLTVPDES